jgi:urease accessory protein
VMDADSRVMRGGKPFVFTNCLTGRGIADLIALVRRNMLFDLDPVPEPAQ